MGKSPQQLADRNAGKFKALKKSLNLSWDDFIRTSDRKRHWLNVTALWQKLVGAGDIYKKSYRGLYCVGHEAFITEKDLVNGRCRDHEAKPEVVKEENYFFRLSRYAKKVAALIRKDQLKIYPVSRANEVLSFIKKGIEDISFSRPRQDLPWGIPVPGDDSQTIYVWCDALVNYLHPKNQWPASLHVIGKDILRFHALYWPAMLLSAKLPLPAALFVHGHLTVDGRKISKTLGNVVDPFALVKQYGTDAVRYYLLRRVPPFADGDFSQRRFKECYNADLANGLGNLAARVFALARQLGVKKSRSNKEIKDLVAAAGKRVEKELEKYRLDRALEAIWFLISEGDDYINRNKPWQSKNKQVVAACLFLVDELAELLEPFLPETAEKIRRRQAKSLFLRLK